MKKSILVVGFLVVASAAGLTGCATTEEKADGAEQGEKVSTLPWNTPEKWERSAPIGGGASY